MRRGRSIAPRRTIFIGVEGRSDHAFVQFLEKRCERKDRHLHPVIHSAKGGDSVAVIESAIRHLSKNPPAKGFRQQFVLLDEDRIQQDKKAGRDAYVVASKHKIDIILQIPNLEGLLYRLHQGKEQRQLPANTTMAELQKLWPEYNKSLTADHLYQRFNLDDLRRVARHDTHLQRLLTILEIDK